MPLHPAENRGYRELYLTGRQTVKRLGRLAVAFEGSPARELLDKAADSISRLLEELGPLTARHDLHGGVAAQGSGANLGTVRGAVFDRFLERNQALRFAVEDLEHVTTLLGYLARVSETRGDPELPDFCRSWERRLRRQVNAVRKAAIELGGDPDRAVESARRLSRQPGGPPRRLDPRLGRRVDGPAGGKAQESYGEVGNANPHFWLGISRL